MDVSSYRNLEVWQEGVELVERIYGVTAAFPGRETYGLASQRQRASVSIPSNVAEGHARSPTREFLHHISIALGSLAELETQLVVATRLGYTDGEKGQEGWRWTGWGRCCARCRRS